MNSLEAMYQWSAQSQRLGPFRRLERVCGDWTIVAEEFPFPDGSTQWAVRAEHKAGIRTEYTFGVPWTVGRVPVGPNLHDDPHAEIARLERLIDWPAAKVVLPIGLWSSR